jgi:hypothetical protein
MDDDTILTKEELYEKRSLETLESELWKEIHNPYKKFFDKQSINSLSLKEKEEKIKILADKIKNYKVIHARVSQYNADDMKLYRSDKHNAQDIIKYVNNYIKINPHPSDGKTYTCLYICRDYGESGCLYILLDNVICYQSYVNAIKKRFPDFDIDKEYPWRMWVIVRNEALDKITKNINNLYDNLISDLSKNIIAE